MEPAVDQRLHTCVGAYVGLEEIDDGVWNVWFGPLLLGRFDERDGKIYGVRGLQ